MRDVAAFVMLTLCGDGNLSPRPLGVEAEEQVDEPPLAIHVNLEL